MAVSYIHPFLLAHINHIQYVSMYFISSMLDYCHCGFVSPKARKLFMNLFTSARQCVRSRKFVVGMVVLMIVGAVGGGKALSQLPSSGQTKIVNCPSQTGSCVTPQPTIVLQNAISFTIEKTGHPRPRPKRVVKAHPVVPAPISAVRVYPTPVPTQLPVVTPPPPPTSTPIPTGQSSVATMIDQVFGPYAQGALQVARCESGLNPDAYNPTSIGGSHAEGVFQILYPSTWMGTSEAGSSPYNAQANILAAHQIFVRDGYNWHEWSCAA